MFNDIIDQTTMMSVLLSKNQKWKDANKYWRIGQGLHQSNKINTPDEESNYDGDFTTNLRFLNTGWLLAKTVCLCDNKTMPWFDTVNGTGEPVNPELVVVILISSAFASRRDGTKQITILSSDKTHPGFYSCDEPTNNKLEASYMLCETPFVYKNGSAVPFSVYGNVGMVLDIDGFGYVYQSFRGTTNMKMKTIEAPEGIEYTVGRILFEQWEKICVGPNPQKDNLEFIRDLKVSIGKFLATNKKQIIRPGDTIEISPTKSDFRPSGASIYQNNIVLNFNLTLAEIGTVLGH